MPKEEKSLSAAHAKEIGSVQLPKSMIAALGKMPGSEGNHDQTAKHRQYCANVARLGSMQLQQLLQSPVSLYSLRVTVPTADEGTASAK